MDDMELVRQYAAEKSESAFRTLVDRHLCLVYSAALRQVGDPFLAEDVSQAVFLLLARKAERLSEKTVLTGWLYRTTCYTAAKALRQEWRRRCHEQEALSLPNAEPDDHWEQMVPFLDEAMAQLDESDRGALLLRYFQNRSFREVGSALGVSDDAAQKRVSRALHKLRGTFAKRGVTLSAVVVTGLLETRAAQFAPLGLAKSVAAAAKGHAAMSPSLHALLQETVRQVRWSKLFTIEATATFTAVVIGAVFLLGPRQPSHASVLPQASPILSPVPSLAVPAASGRPKADLPPAQATVSNASPRVAVASRQTLPTSAPTTTNAAMTVRGPGELATSKSPSRSPGSAPAVPATTGWPQADLPSNGSPPLNWYNTPLRVTRPSSPRSPTATFAVTNVAKPPSGVELAGGRVYKPETGLRPNGQDLVLQQSIFLSPQRTRLPIAALANRRQP